jgi:hypothetical protein
MKDGGREKPTDQPVAVKDGDRAIETPQRTPGKGQTKTLFDETPSPPLSAGAADAELEKAYNAIKQAQEQKRRRSARPPSGTVKDW